MKDRYQGYCYQGMEYVIELQELIQNKYKKPLLGMAQCCTTGHTWSELVHRSAIEFYIQLHCMNTFIV